MTHHFRTCYFLRVDFSPQGFLDLHFPDFTARHIFTAKLRLVILVGFWIIAVFFYPGLLTLEQPVMLLVSLTFVVTTICHAFILRGIASVPFFILELVADVAAQTILVYLTGGPHSSYFTIYIIYCASGGLFYNVRVSAIISIIVFFFYTGLVLATNWGWIHEFYYPFADAGIVKVFGPFQNVVLLMFLLAVGIYGIWISSYFSKLRERALETKNRELVVLNEISSMTRSVITLERVIEALLGGVSRGLGYQAALLFYRDSEDGLVTLFIPESLSQGSGVQTMSITDPAHPVYQAMKEQKVLVRSDVKTLFDGIDNRFCQYIMAPLVAEEKVLGTLVGLSREEKIEEGAIHSFEGFADQAALTIDNTLLIAELKKKNLELERVSRIKSEFLATMSHELRTPLTAIIGFSELLMEETMGTLNPEQRESLREVLANAESLLQMINSLLDLTKIESGKMELSIDLVDVKGVIDRVQKMMSSLVQKKSQTLVTRMIDHFPIIYADEKKLQQILLNLISNAIKFTPEKGSIEILVDLVKPKAQGVDSLRITVVDTGIGIPKEHLETIFDSFRQVDSSYTREYQGTGLGLSLVKQFVEMHGGKIWVESVLSQGSRFTFMIPNKKPMLSQ